MADDIRLLRQQLDQLDASLAALQYMSFSIMLLSAVAFIALCFVLAAERFGRV
jgi:hypothetical protein